MKTKRQILLDMVQAERSRQLDLPRTEFDSLKTPNDWASITGHYLYECAVRGGLPQNADTVEANGIKAMAVILAMLEHIQAMKDNGSIDSN